ncbi:uncharacterized protein LOC124399625 isoform X2 [Silurus meridionalis]|nr:uncharacterized protein LOC124399625 isoform X2 [Silurus meridionalis]XP_046726653.1 uncharacterized protein LOC124399625 isoform X2 [Silurus meridionalis]
MQSFGGEEHLDGVHCLWPLCPHPCCWETERRIATGAYRRGVGVPTKHHASVDESSPRLTVVDVSEWAGKRMRPVRPDRRNLSGMNSEVEPLQKDTDTKTKNPCFPAITSAPSESHTRNKAVNDRTAHIPPLIGSSCRSPSLMLWVPNPHHNPQCSKSISSEVPRCTIKELFCLPAAHTHTTSASNREGTTKKRVRFQLFHSPVRFHSSQQAESVSAAQLEAGAGDGTKLLSDPSAFLLKNRPVIFHSVQERAIRTASQEAPASLYKLDSKTAEEDADWDRLRIQPNLWKRHVSLEGFRPPGGARGIPETGSSYPGSKASSDRTICSPQCAGPTIRACVKRMVRYSRCTHPLLSHKKHCRGTRSELDMTICSSTTIKEHNQILNTDERYEGDGGSPTKLRF